MIDSLVPLLINSAKIKYAVLDDLFKDVHIPDNTVNLYLDGFYIFYKLYRSEYLVDVNTTDIGSFIKDVVISTLNTVAHYRRYLFTRLHKTNRIFIVFNRRAPKYQTALISYYGKAYYEKLYPTHFQYGPINLIIEQAVDMLKELCSYIEDVFLIDNRQVEDHTTIAYLKTLYSGFNIYYSRNELMSLIMDRNSLCIYPKRDDSKLSGYNTFFYNYFSKVKYKPIYLTTEYAKFYFILSGVKSKSIPGTCVNGQVKGSRILDSMIESDSIDIHTSLQRFIEILPRFLKRGLALEEEKSMTLLYKAIDVRTSMAALTSAQKARINNSLVNLFDQSGLEELNELIAMADDTINLTDLNMSKAREPKSYWNWDDM